MVEIHHPFSEQEKFVTWWGDVVQKTGWGQAVSRPFTPIGVNARRGRRVPLRHQSAASFQVA